MSQVQNRKLLALACSYPQEDNSLSQTRDIIYGSINPPPEAVKAGTAIPLPRGKFDIKLVLNQLPKNWKPDLITISSSLALGKNPSIPTGLQNLSYQSVMKLTDSHHMHRPIQKLIDQGYRNVEKRAFGLLILLKLIVEKI